MSTANAIQDYSLSMDRTLNAGKQAVYEGLTDKDALSTWFAPTEEMNTIVHEQELKVGGKYRIEMLETDGTSHMVHGEYVALNPYEQLIFTWEWESDEQHVNSLVTIDLTESKGKTEMKLTHEKLTSQESVELHSDGWIGCLGQLSKYF